MKALKQREMILKRGLPLFRGRIFVLTIELDKGIGEARLDGKKMSDDSVYDAGKNSIEIDGGIGELSITFKAKDDEKELKQNEKFNKNSFIGMYSSYISYFNYDKRSII